MLGDSDSSREGGAGMSEVTFLEWVTAVSRYNWRRNTLMPHGAIEDRREPWRGNKRGAREPYSFVANWRGKKGFQWEEAPQ